jgi:L-histidine N-alpha-methyltransferase
MGEERVQIERHLDPSVSVETMSREIREGLTAASKRLPSKYFYDERGSLLFEKITELPEYYLTRAEWALLEAEAAEIARLSRFGELVELGSGSARKTRLLLEAGLNAGTLRNYTLVEVDPSSAERAARRIARRYPGLDIHAVVGDFEHHLERLPDGGRRLVAFLGSTIGNFTEDQATEFLFQVGGLLERDDRFLLGTDLVKNVARIEAAYNDSAGVTAEFNSNILEVINRRLGGNFDLNAFEHVSFYNGERSRIETYLRARTAQRVHLAAIDLDVDFAAGESILTEVSCKYTRRSVERLLAGAGLALEHWLPDDEGAYALSLSRLA